MMDWYLENADGTEYRIDVDKWKLELHAILDTFYPNTANVTLSRAVTTTKKQWIRAVEHGKTTFLGYIAENPQSYHEGQKTIVAYGAENLLWAYPCPLQTYWGTTVYLSQVFGHADPDTTTDKDNIPGLLFAANSQIPPGWREDTLPTDTDDRWIAHGPGEIIDAINGIVKYPNMGTRSRIGTAAIFVDGYPYTDVASYADMASGTAAVWRDEDDLYIRFWVAGALVPHFRNAPVYAKNAFDTRCRFGSIDTDSVLDVQLLVDSGIMAGDVILNLARSSGQYLRFVYVGKLCYMYVVANFDDLGETEILENECDKVKFSPSAELNPDAVTGAGHGGNKTRQFQSIFSTKPGGAYVRRVADFPYTFFDRNQTLEGQTGAFTPTVHHGMLYDNTLAHWLESQKVPPIELELGSRNIPAPGSILRVVGRDAVTNDDALINTVELDESGKLRIVAGSEIQTIEDAQRGVQSLNAVYSTVKNDFNVVAELSSNMRMADYIDRSGWGYPYPTTSTTHYISTWSRFQNASAWGFPENTAPTITSYGIPYYRDHNIRLLLDLSLDLSDVPKTQFTAGKCYLFLCSRYTLDGSIPDLIHPDSYIRFNPLEEDIVGWDITQYLSYGGVTNLYALHVVLYSSSWMTCYYTGPPYDYLSYVTADLKLTLVEQGYTAKRVVMRADPGDYWRCGGLTLS